MSPYTPEVKTFALLTQALLALQVREPERALARAEEVRRLQQGPTQPYEAAAGHLADARAAYQQAVSLCEMLKAPALAAEGYAGLANAAFCEGDSQGYQHGTPPGVIKTITGITFF